MIVTDVAVRLHVSDRPTRLLGHAIITLDGQFVIRNVRLIKSAKTGFHVAMPSEAAHDERGHYFRDLVFPIDADLRKEITDKCRAALAVERESVAAMEEAYA